MDSFSIVIAVIVIGCLIWAVVRLGKRSSHPPNLRVAMELIINIDENFKIIRQKANDPQSLKKLKTGHWNTYREYLDFLSQETVEALQAAFKQIEEYNSGIDVAVKGSSPPPALSQEELVGPLTRGRAGLAAWVRDNIGRESNRGLFNLR
jgi:hypothetical protein